MGHGHGKISGLYDLAPGFSRGYLACYEVVLFFQKPA